MGNLAPYAGKPRDGGVQQHGRPARCGVPKSVRLDLRVTAATKSALQAIADAERRTIASLVDEAIENYTKLKAGKL